MAMAENLILLEGQRLAGGDPQLPLHEIENCTRLGDGMLDLTAPVHFHEIEGVALGDELDGTRADIADRARRGDCDIAHPAPLRVTQARRGCLLDHLLMTALYRAVPLQEVHPLATAAAVRLALEVPRPRQASLAQPPSPPPYPPTPPLHAL